MKTMTLLAVCFLLAAPGSLSAQTRTLELDKNGIRTLEIFAGAGSLEVEGAANASTIEVRAEIDIRSIDRDDREEFLKRRVELSLEKRGNRARLVSRVDNSFFSRGNARINLRVRVPAAMDLSIDDGSGSIDIENISGNVDLEDGSGSITVRDIAGDVNIDDGSGSVDITDIRGNVDVDDGSGSLRIRDIDGNVRVSDGSGGISIRNVTKDVYIREDGSGSVDISRVDGRITRRD